MWSEQKKRLKKQNKTDIRKFFMTSQKVQMIPVVEKLVECLPQGCGSGREGARRSKPAKNTRATKCP